MTIPRNLSFLAEGASSTGVLGTANGGTGLSTLGTAGQALVVNSGATGLTYSTPSAGALVYLSTTTASGVSSLAIETGFSSTYNNYIIIGNNIIPDTNATYLYAQVKQGGTYLTSNYVYNIQYGDTAVASSYFEVASGGITNGVKTASYINNTSTDSGAYYTLNLQVYGANTSQTQVITGTVTGSSSPDRGRWNDFTGMVNNTSASGTLSGIKILVGSGTFTGTFRLYGIS